MSDLPTPWKRAKQLRSGLQEEGIARMRGGKKQVNSGRFWRWKRDAILHEFLIEARTTDKRDSDSYRISRKEFLSIRKEALQTPPGLLPAMAIQIQDLHLMVMELAVFQGREIRLMEMEARVEELERQLEGD